MNKRILVVDDNPINLKLLGDVLESEQYVVDRAADGHQALTRMNSTLPDLILLDIAMPGIDGLTLTRQLKAAETTSHIPIFIVTASAMKGDAERARASGCDDYIPKPINMTTLVEKIRNCLATK